MATCTRVFSTVGTSDPTGFGFNWSNTGNVFASDDSRATVSITNSNGISDFIEVTNSSHSSGTALGASDTITQIDWKVEVSKAGNPAANCRDYQLYPIENGTRVTTTNYATASDYGTSDAVATHSQTTNIPSASVVLASNWGFAFSCQNTNGQAGATGQVDRIFADITFTPAVPPFPDKPFPGMPAPLLAM